MLQNIIITIGVSLFFCAFFSGIEIAFLTANQLRIELRSKKGIFSSQILSYFVKHPSRFFTTTLVGNNIALVLYSIYASTLILQLIFPDAGMRALHEHDKMVLLIQTLISSFIILIFGEFLPKAFFRSSPNLLLNILSLPFLLFYFLLYPLVMLIVFLASLILRFVFNTRISPQAPEFTRYDLFHYVSESTPVNEENPIDVDKEIFKNAIEFPFLKVRDCMTPRTDIVAVDIKETIEKVKALFIESGHSKLPVYRENIDHVTGYIHIVDLYANPAEISDIVMPIIISTEAMPVTELMKQLIDKHRSISLVVDEFGGTSGLITMEDIIEEIIGDISDEHDVDDMVETQLSDHEFIFSARIKIDYLNEKYNLSLPEGDYETLGGLILFEHQNIPNQGDIIKFPPFEFTILSTDQARINEVNMKVDMG